MPKPIIRLLVCSLLVLVASATFLPGAFGASLYEYNNGTRTNWWGIGGTSGGYPWASQGFTVGAAAHTVTSIKVYMCRQYSGSGGTITLSVRASSGGLPTGSDLTSGTTNGATLPLCATYEWREVAVTEYSLAATTTYQIVARTTDASYGLAWGARDGYSGGNRGQKDTAAGAWWSNGYDELFEVYGNAAVVTTTTTTTALVYTTNYGAETATVLTTLTNNATETEYSTHLTTVLGATNTLSTTTTTSLATNTTLLTTTRTTTSFAIQNSTWTTNTTTTANVTTTSNTATATSLSTTTLTESALSTTTNTTTIGTSTHLATLTTPITTLLTTFTGGTSTIGTTTTTTTTAPTVIIQLIYTERRTTTISSYFTEQLRITQNRTYTQFDQEWVTQTNETLEILRTILYDTLVIINSTITTIVMILVPYLAGGTESYAVLAVIFGAGSVLILFAVEAKRR